VTFSSIECLTRGPESVASAASYETHTSCGQLSYPRAAAGEWPQCHRSNFPSWDGSFATTVESETPTVVPTPSSGKSVPPLKH